MKSQIEHGKFIELRACGLSFDSIAKKLKISKPTLLRWQEQYSKEIAELRFINMEALIEQYSMIKEKRIERLGKLLKKIDTELQSRELKDMDSEKLINLSLVIEKRLKEEIRGVSNMSYEETRSIHDTDLMNTKQQVFIGNID